MSRSVTPAPAAKPKAKAPVKMATPAASNLATSLSASLTNSVCRHCKRGDIKGLAEELKLVPSISDSIRILNYTDRNGSTPLFHCAWKGDVGMINFMIDHGADAHWANFRKNFPIDMAIETNSYDAVKAFIAQGAEITKEHWNEKGGVKERLKKRNGVTKEDVQNMYSLLKTCMVGERRPPSHSAEQKADCGNVGFSKQATTSVTDGQLGHAVIDDEDDGMPDQHSDEAERNMKYLPDEYKDKLWLIFDDCDIDKNKSLDFDEVFQMNKRLEPDTAEEECAMDAKDFMEYVDGDDGGSVTIKEWTDAWERLVTNEGLGPLNSFILSYKEAIGFKGHTV